jgi:DNA helicase-2/ATP-dependent DNA helicase PcrA
VELEEERRLMYVGITRAKEKVYLCFTQQRNIFGSTQVNPPSRFLSEIPEHLMEKYEAQNFNREKNINSAIKNPNDIIEKFRDGEKVAHPDFGEGIVISTQENIITVVFKKFGIKKLAVEFAKLKKI